MVGVVKQEYGDDRIQLADALQSTPDVDRFSRNGGKSNYEYAVA